MKLRLSFLLLACYTLSSYGQAIGKEFLFDEYQKGKVVFKNGKTSESLLNYDMVTEKLLFISPDSTVLQVSNPETIALVKIGDRAFEHVKDGTLYERVAAGENTVFYIRWHTRILSKGKPSGYGTTSSTASISNISHLNNSSQGIVHVLKVNDGYVATPECLFYLKIRKNFKRFSSVDSFAKFFKGHEDEIRKYAKDQNIKFDNVEDIKKLIVFCSDFGV